MLVLGINTASKDTEIALVGKVEKASNVEAKLPLLQEESSWQSTSNEAEKLLPEISKLLKKSGRDFSDLTAVFVVKGPGSFTGLRVGVATANAITYLTGCKLFAMDTFEYWWAKAKRSQQTKSENSARADFPSENSSQKFQNKTVQTGTSSRALLIYAGLGGMYVSTNGENADKCKLLNMQQLAEFLMENKTQEVFGDIRDPQKEQIQSHESLSSLKFIAPQKTFGQFLSGLNLDPLIAEKIISPVYVKKPSITQGKSRIF